MKKWNCAHGYFVSVRVHTQCPHGEAQTDGLGTGLAPSGLMGDKGFVAEARIMIP